MKKITIIILSCILTTGAASAQKGVARPAPRVIYYSTPYYYSPFWNPYFYGGFGYNWYGRPGYYNHSTKMQKQIQDIENDYKDRIESVRSDDSLSGKERRQKIRALKHDRDKEIADFKKNYYKKFEN
ncbi:hypothetical protein [Parafilimonas sp.]|uniref:hypothetical protein n=1 Tax=Parafilimonas sp. TaxID=1969739 RepID=UPI0039E38617